MSSWWGSRRESIDPAEALLRGDSTGSGGSQSYKAALVSPSRLPDGAAQPEQRGGGEDRPAWEVPDGATDGMPEAQRFVTAPEELPRFVTAPEDPVRRPTARAITI